jgi:hypothetical protein
MSATSTEVRTPDPVCSPPLNLDGRNLPHKNLTTWDRCYDFLNIFAENVCEKMAFLIQNKAKFGKS